MAPSPDRRARDHATPSSASTTRAATSCGPASSEPRVRTRQLASPWMPPARTWSGAQVAPSPARRTRPRTAPFPTPAGTQLPTFVAQQPRYALAPSLLRPDAAATFRRPRQFGSSSYDLAWGMALDASGAYVAGRTGGASGYEPDPSDDAFVRKYDASGNLLWADQFGSSAADWANWIAVDASGAYVAGVTFGGTLPGQTSAGSDDGFVRKYDASGNVVWTRQFGTSADDQAYAIAVDASGAYVAGYAAGALPEQASTGGFDAFVRKYDVNGNEVWTRQFGTQANANLGVLPGSVPWAIYAAVAAGAAALGSAGGLLWRRRRRSRTPPAQPPPPVT